MTLPDNASTSERQPLLANGQGSRLTDVTQEHSLRAGHKDGQHIDELDEVTRLTTLQLLPWYKRPSIAWLLPFVFMIAIVMGVSQAAQDQLIVKIICKDYHKGSNIPGQSSNTIIANTSGDFTHKSYYDDDSCSTTAIQALAALVMSRFRSLKYVTGIFTIGYHTSLSDVYGRKTLMFLTLIPALLTQLLIVYMAHPATNVGIGVLYVDALIMGLLGAGLLLEPAIFAYVADCTARADRSLSIGYMMVALAVGMIFGSILGGYLFKLTGDVTSAMTISIATLSVLIVYAMVLPESLPKNLQEGRIKKGSNADLSTTTAKPASISIMTIKKSLLMIFDPLLLFVPGRIDASGDVNVVPSKYMLVILIGAYGCLQFAVNGILVILIPYTNLVFKWTAAEDGAYYALSGVATFIVYVGIFPYLQKLYKIYIDKQSPKKTVHPTTPSSPLYSETGESFGNDDARMTEEALRPEITGTMAPAQDVAAMAEKRWKTLWADLTFFISGCIIFTIGYLIVFIFETDTSMFISCCIRALASISNPSFNSLLTSFVPVHQTGKALGGICILDTIIMSLSSLLYGWIFSETSVVMPSAVFLTSAVFSSFSFLASLSIWGLYRQ
ncbi:hypothetical protein BX616_003301 [Lobosporangium transversale]|uniref:Major facilitator superfamily domain-containing protein n=1 Tax=Lobosporangium transversale TaxID=64571 RepID=A0A1Y2GJI2_9FUNG|nr:major facilitator superfamily domain-containing protein [Lobosporangium transversale]KAF9916624.1 hypothetical protein BX616_003301 [Lobosporangium transversale]ORZ12888.1 major facilitator superfamily domain-containing protein [Lobosporangium transversale]|eukprot:XP_021880237.1 major facilitator superfamily domain-containing protein [Lobosporangium transversale]